MTPYKKEAISQRLFQRICRSWRGVFGSFFRFVEVQSGEQSTLFSSARYLLVFCGRILPLGENALGETLSLVLKQGGGELSGWVGIARECRGSRNRLVGVGIISLSRQWDRRTYGESCFNLATNDDSSYSSLSMAILSNSISFISSNLSRSFSILNYLLIWSSSDFPNSGNFSGDFFDFLLCPIVSFSICLSSISFCLLSFRSLSSCSLQFLASMMSLVLSCIGRSPFIVDSISELGLIVHFLKHSWECKASPMHLQCRLGGLKSERFWSVGMRSLGADLAEVSLSSSLPFFLTSYHMRLVINYITSAMQQAPTAKQPTPEQSALADPERWNYIPFTEQYVLRKETIAIASDVAMKRLLRESAIAKQQYRKKVAENKDAKMELEYENYPAKREFAKLREYYANQSSSAQLMKKNLDKLKAKVDKVTKEIRLKEAMTVKDSDLVKIYKISSTNPRPQPPPLQPQRPLGQK